MRNRRKNFAFALIAFVVPFLIVELGARVISSCGTYDYIEKRLLEQNFRPRKKKDEFRIFLFGESTMHGSHLYPESTIGKWIKLYLDNLLDPQVAQRVTVTNLSRLGVNSHFISQVFLDTLHYQPDLAVFYTAHNDLTLRDDKWEILDKSFNRRAELFFKNLIKKSAFVSACRRIGIKRRMARKKKKEEHANHDEWYDHTKRHFWKAEQDQLDPQSKGAKEIIRLWQNNILKVIKAARMRKVPVIFFKGLARYNSFEPYASVHRKDLTQDELKRWEGLFKYAQSFSAQRQYAQALEIYEECLKIDPKYALTYFEMGRCYEKLGNILFAKKAYRMANDMDFTPIRGPSAINEFYDKVSSLAYPGVTIIPTQRIFEAQSPKGMIDSNLVIDQLHPTMRGQAIMAVEICKIIYKEDLLTKKDRWHWGRLKTFEELSKNLKIDDEARYQALMFSATYVGSYFDIAINFLNQALELRPKALRARSQLAWTYFKKGEKRKARQIYDALILEFEKEAKTFFKKYPRIKQDLYN